MMAENQTGAIAPLSFENTNEKMARLTQDVAQHRNVIVELLKLVETLHEEKKEADGLENRIVHLRRTEQNLMLARAGAHDVDATGFAACHLQTQFLSMLAHELRNPLAPIALANELLGKMTALDPNLPKIHAVIDRQVTRMVRLVDDLLDASLVSSGKIALQKRLLLLSEIIDGALETSRPFIDKREQKLAVELPTDALVIYGDPVRLAQVFSNLLINASKFSSENECITLSAEKHANTVKVHVKDHGVGIAAQIQPFLFDLFTQGYRSQERSQGGLGIGLFLVRTIVELHGGSAEVHSKGVGYGSEFIVQLPLSAEPLPSNYHSPLKSSKVRVRQILLIEDNVDANDTLKLFLELEGHTVTSMFDGPSGLATARQNIYDVIICDIGLPGMNGYEVLKKLRIHSTQSQPCFIAMSGYNQAEDRARAMEVGFDHYLVKPISIEFLLSLVSPKLGR